MNPIKKGATTRDKEQRKDSISIEDVKEKYSIALCATKKQNIRHVDSGYSKHMTRDPNKFIILRRDKKGKFTLGDNISSKIIQKGIVAIRDNKIKAENVLLVENITPNLLSVSQKCDQGYVYIFDSEKCEIRKRNQENLLGLM